MNRLSLAFWKWFNFRGLRLAYRKLSLNDSYDFIYKSSSTNTVLYKSQEELREEALKMAPQSGMVLEFGVFNGKTINFFSKILEKVGDSRAIVGFDSFRGFSQVWTGVDNEFPSSRFDRNGVFPEVAENVQLIDGYIEDTLPEFVASVGELDVSFVHIDTDTYSPASVVLKCLKPYLSSGSIILFDELCGYPNWRAHEYRALVENFAEDEYEFIGFSVGARSINLMNAAIRIL